MPPIKGDDGTPSGFTPSSSFGVWGDSGGVGPFGTPGNGVVGSSRLGSGVAGFTLATARPFRAAGVFGSGPVGVAGYVTGANTAPGAPVAVYGAGSNGHGLGFTGVEGESDSGTGVLGVSSSGRGVVGNSDTGVAVVGIGAQNIGVAGISDGIGVLGVGGQAAEFIGAVNVTGTLTKGGGGFLIDHPLEPANRTLCHSFVESPDMKNVYDGIAECDQRGEAVVELPDWFEALNASFRYQLTPIGAAAPHLHIAAEVSENRFKIAGGSVGLKVSWQVTGIRQDAWARAHRLAVEREKTPAQRGRFLHPEEHGKPVEDGVHHHLAALAHSDLGRNR
ncbi:MAG TPA: hypothetical protein VHB47_24475 [Thermoanaerobaculia bacterium]|jgi:hypothetical protein|nr:hypothetical protein [Thermoanaerobaculia bacterium]